MSMLTTGAGSAGSGTEVWPGTGCWGALDGEEGGAEVGDEELGDVEEGDEEEGGADVGEPVVVRTTGPPGLSAAVPPASAPHWVPSTEAPTTAAAAAVMANHAPPRIAPRRMTSP
ncbi:hypothetical protein GCM10022403_037530 [Streptomyces coacervatus]|uniref:Uncharacterized protein n=1 Tax=Streptomyces coacervatus TaxID=647381 RepID=A0ABP7HS56_9ACTN